ncbi:hypothetical protein [Lentzea cavernae]|uniref:DUF4268 domain-containing protein n=1 Tax=Lentzea cavernae TaxID=2020703 RepID=A0ABQ3MMC6_9PSEU|nr:hypothetical protein [Lentzea cavernae]GHH43840.1 hypothetical protein GCM10017774_42130 [Lentzea cavernae]
MTVTLDPQNVVRELILWGEEAPGRRGDRTVVAESHCDFTLGDDEAVERCIAALQASDEKLAKNPGTMYNWQRTWLQRHEEGGGTVTFGVAWYDEQYFNDKKTVFMERMHDAIFNKIGISADAVQVTHWRAVP